MTTICTAGHRPDRLGGYELHVAARLMYVARRALDELQPSKLVCGMAIGWDLALGLAAVERGIPVVCAVPFHNHASKYSKTAAAAAQKVYEASTDCVYVTMRTLTDAAEISAAFKLRNEWMVDNSDSVAALWNGDKHSGTWHCIHYAMRKNKPTTNFWSVWANAVESEKR